MKKRSAVFLVGDLRPEHHCEHSCAGRRCPPARVQRELRGAQLGSAQGLRDLQRKDVVLADR
jgi:hypothetical protein